MVIFCLCPAGNGQRKMLLSIAVWLSIAHAMYERSVAAGIGTTYLQEAMAFEQDLSRQMENLFD